MVRSDGRVGLDVDGPASGDESSEMISCFFCLGGVCGGDIIVDRDRLQAEDGDEVEEGGWGGSEVSSLAAASTSDRGSATRMTVSRTGLSA